jgi:HEAT repeat protein
MSAPLLLLLLPMLAQAAPCAPGAPARALPGATLAPGAAVLAQDDKREDVAALLDALGDHVKRKGVEDTAAVGVIDELLTLFDDCGPKDRKAIAKELGDCLAAKRKPREDGEPDNTLYIAAAVALGEMGPESVKVLETNIGHKRHKKNTPLRRRLILSLGKTRDEGAAKELMDLLQHHEPVLQAAAAEAVGNYDEAEQKLRKKLFNELLKLLMGAKAAADDITDQVAKERYRTVAGPIITSMGLLTGEDIRVPEEWQRWWNKNKSKDWEG